MQFRPLTIDDSALIRPYFAKLKTITCNLTSGTMLMWRNSMSAEIAVSDDTLFCRANPRGEGYLYFLPSGGDVQSGLRTLAEYAAGEGDELRIVSIPEDYLPEVRAALDVTDEREEENSFDYVYMAEDLSTFRGKRYSGQRNHINQFLRSCEQWEFKKLGADNVRQVIDFFLRAYPETPDEPYFKRIENAMVLEVLQNLDRYGMLGGVLTADGEVVGFSMGETVRDTLLTHVEKADRNRHGAFQMTVREFTAMYSAGGIKYVNREDDMGDAGLRAAKRALHPAELKRKFAVTAKTAAM
ncbi:MAG: phosphatidylglycerol lysyltransferase domain-containing protein [Oscillospiraceae bacterium]|nr:phosphatidylglycerol lysyltransferase domain-containing protein [Oscillospiraceae bacterium]